MIHFDWTISIGQIAATIAALGVLIRIEQAMSFFRIEHEILMVDYCDRKQIEVSDLPTRSSRSSR